MLKGSIPNVSGSIEGGAINLPNNGEQQNLLIFKDGNDLILHTIKSDLKVVMGFKLFNFCVKEEIPR